MPSAEPSPRSAPRTLWVSVEVVQEDVDGSVTHYAIEGRPDGRPLSVDLDPTFRGKAPLGVLETIGVSLSGTLKDCTLMVTNDPEEHHPATRLRLLE